ncbi:MAG: tRNA (adenosine(37)-N6)-threonylcarbamoyltransferase complex ATPase subunit type 1 TsaE [Gammaproteobacteria bacterium]|nr:tRNA (adenosine(37)-N6)-threonylcarbamoyltransferase complex ATPase subunit type 1 TsaE [Gammaproteobacteria bacterium]MDP7660704.1 tRNA (adenosine(37)-N6)-threonylcarbamoyltransferase complex ATPase subunit type 1 TsaE [Gammaproteobacteria bacterium]HJP38545.1 tRNA (adenosine(37)-N6)-threonylcarbamoyltransferase complex ATPase subunit type 1 TsaE [Gammaproteobacteria bacterium]
MQLDSSAAMEAAGGRLARAVSEGGIDSLVIYLCGDLGAGKTTFVRGFLQALGHTGRVPSPTYTLIEPYDIAGFEVSHIDLYRLRSPGEAESLALAELCGSRMLMLIEWPENGAAAVPAADLRVELAIDGQGRAMQLVGLSAAGKTLVSQKN